MILRYHPRLIINTGVAGGMGKGIKISDIVVADSVVQHDMDTSDLGDPKGFISGIDRIQIPCDEELNDKVRAAAGAVEGVHLYEKTLDADSSWLDQPLCRIHTGDRLVILVRRGVQVLIPDGDTVLRLGDRLVINDPQSKS